MCFNLGKEEVGGEREKKHIWGLLGGVWELSAASRVFPHQSSLLCTTHGCTEELAWLVASSHAQNSHHRIVAWLTPAPSDVQSDSNNFHCVQDSLTALTGIHSLPQTWNWSYTQETAQWAVTRDGMNISKRDLASQVLKYVAGSQSPLVTLPRMGKSKSCTLEWCHMTQMPQCPTYIKTWVRVLKKKKKRHTSNIGKVSLWDSSMYWSSYHILWAISVSSLLFSYILCLTISMLACFKFQQTYFKCCQILMERVLLFTLYQILRIFEDQKLSGI